LVRQSALLQSLSARQLPPVALAAHSFAPEQLPLEQSALLSQPSPTAEYSQKPAVHAPL
jgi:hypothetical protein